MTRFQTVLITASMVIAAMASPAAAAKKSASIKVINQSKWEIHHLYLSSADSVGWGVDQLGEHVLDSGVSFTLKSITCGKYDIKVVDEDGDECVIEDQSLCGGEKVWNITDQELLACEKSHRVDQAPGERRRSTT